MADPSTILAHLQLVGAAAIAICDKIDNTPESENGLQRQSLKELRKAVDSLRSDTLMYKDLLNAMENDTDLSRHSSYTRFIQRQDGKEGMESLERALNATRRLLEENPAGSRHEVTTNPSANKEPRRALSSVLDVLKDNSRRGRRQGLIGDLKDATYEISVCQQNNERAFKLVWNLYVVAQQWNGHHSSIDDVGNIQDPVEQALDSVLHAFHDHPFAVSPEGDSRVDPSTFAILNHDRGTASRHGTFTRRTGKAWVDDRVPKNNAQVGDIGALQTLLFELLWSGTVEQLKRHSPCSSDDPKRPEFSRAVEELERALQEAIIRSKKQRFVVAFCGTVEADKSLFLNALMGRAIFPSDELPSAVWPCRLRHVEGKTVPELQFHAEPFLVGLKKLQSLQYGQKMQNYLSSKNLFGTLGLSEPSNEEILLEKIHNKWIRLHADTRNNMLKFETPGFRLPLMATGEQNVQTLLGQLNDVVRLCQVFDLKFNMSEVDWPLLTVEFSSLRGHRMGGIYEFIDFPNIGKDFRGFNFESLVRLVASDSNTIVPIISFKEIHRNDWKRLPELVASGFNGRANVVFCNHLDQVSQEYMDETLKVVTESFWPKDVLNTNRVIPCSSLMGLSARDLLDRSNPAKPSFEAIYNEHAVGYHCAAKILGAGSPRAAYGQFDVQTWRETLQAELRASGLPDAMQKLKEMVDGPLAKALLGEADTVIRQLREMCTLYERKLLLGATRIETEYDAATRSYNRARKMSQCCLEKWRRIESMQIQEICSLLEQELRMISQKACWLINQTIKRILPDSGMSLEDMGASSNTRELGGVQLGNGHICGKLHGSSSAEAGDNNVIITGSKSQAKDFLRLSQRELSSVLETLKREYAAIILDLAGAENAKLLKVVRWMIKHAELPPLPEDWENRIGDFVPASLHIDGLAFQEILGAIKSRQLSLFHRQYSIDIDTLQDRFEDEIIDPWIRKLKDEGEKTLLGTTGASLKAAKNLTTSPLLEREDRYKRELDEMERDKLIGEEKVVQFTAVYSNLLAAEGALGELFARVETLQI